MIIIGLGYKARQGKNYVANYWKEAHPEIQFYAFADELKKYCRDHHDELEWKWQLAMCTKQQPAHKEDPIYGCTPILQWYGTDVVRKTDPNHWVDIISNKILEEQPPIAVVTDVRFPNEAEWIRLSGGYLVEVIRKNADGSQYIDPSRPAGHPSEVALSDYNFDYTIIAKSGDLDALKSKALGVLENILTHHAAVASGVTRLPFCNDSNLTEVEYVSDLDFDDVFSKPL